MRRTLICLLWSGLFYILVMGVLTLGAVVAARGDSHRRQQLQEELASDWGLAVLFSSIGLAVALGGLGLLPGTRRAGEQSSDAPAAAVAYTPVAIQRSRVTRSPDPIPPTAAREGGPWGANHPLSVHRFAWSGALALGAAALAGVAASLVFAVVALRWAAQKVEQSWLTTAGLGLFGLFLVAAVLGTLIGVAKLVTGRVSEIAICRDGLRWKKRGQERSATWAEVESVKRDVSTMVIRGRIIVTDTLKISLPGGELLRFWNRTLTDYPQFADAVQSLHEQSRYRQAGLGPCISWK
jgi:hypothetical protein